MNNKPELFLTDCDGNSFSIIGRARRIAKKAGWTEAQIQNITNEAMSGDYDHLLQTMMKYFDVK